MPPNFVTKLSGNNLVGHAIARELGVAWRMLLLYTSVTPCRCTKLSFGERHELCAKHKEKHVLGTF